MTVLTVSITDQTFDKRSAEIGYLIRVIDLIQTQLEHNRGTDSGKGAQNVLGKN